MNGLTATYHQNTTVLPEAFTAVDTGSEKSPGKINGCFFQGLDYYPFGSLMPGRNLNASDYRFGFNGMEKDDEFTGVTGSHLNFGARIYDSRTGSFLSVDPLWKDYTAWSPYNGFNRNPIWYVDPTGKGGEFSNFRSQNGDYAADLTFNINLVADEISVEEVTKMLSDQGISIGESIDVGSGSIKAGIMGDIENVHVDVKVKINVISADEAKKQIANNTDAAQNFIYVADSERFVERNFRGSNQGIITTGYLSSPEALDVMTHWAWHSADARYKNSGFDIGGHNKIESAKMSGRAPDVTGNLIQMDFDALSSPEAQKQADKGGHNLDYLKLFNMTDSKGNYINSYTVGRGYMQNYYNPSQYEDLMDEGGEEHEDRIDPNIITK
jgi:RHS repeat-associated protein